MGRKRFLPADTNLPELPEDYRSAKAFDIRVADRSDFQSSLRSRLPARDTRLALEHEDRSPDREIYLFQ
jgi:hypothetical protein